MTASRVGADWDDVFADAATTIATVAASSNGDLHVAGNIFAGAATPSPAAVAIRDALTQLLLDATPVSRSDWARAYDHFTRAQVLAALDTIARADPTAARQRVLDIFAGKP